MDTPGKRSFLGSLEDLELLKINSVVDVAQLVELRIVVPAVVGSSPIIHPNAR